MRTIAVMGRDEMDEGNRDMVEVVRCWDCKWWEFTPSLTAMPDYHICKRVGILHTIGNDYCSRGERRDG